MAKEPSPRRFALRDLYIVRHGEAIDRGTLAVDDNRWLTPEGRRRFYKLARRFARKEGRARIEAILTSPLPRAVMTAELLAHALRLRGPVEVCDALRPDASGDSALSLLLSQQRCVAVVGHEPLLSHLISELCPAGTSYAPPAPPQEEQKLPKGGIAALRFSDGKEPGRARLRFVEAP